MTRPFDLPPADHYAHGTHARYAWKLVHELLDAGLTKSEIGRGIGQHHPTLQLGERLVEARTALLVRKLHARVMAQGERGQFPRDAADARFIRADVVAAVVDRLCALGLSKREIGRRIGFQMNKPRCTPGTLRKIAERRIPDVARVCTDCGASHAPEDRQARLARLLPAEAADLHEALPCYYPIGEVGDRRLYRDLAAIGAVNVRGTWQRREQGAEAAA